MSKNNKDLDNTSPRKQENKIILFFKKVVQVLWALICTISYIVGIYVVEFFMAFLSKLDIVTFFISNIMTKYITVTFNKFFETVFEHLVDFVKDLSHFFYKIYSFLNILKNRVFKVYKEDGKEKALVEAKDVFKTGYATNIITIRRVTNILAPVVSVMFFVTVIFTVSNLNFALNVNYNGKNVGVVKNEKSFDTSKSQMLSQVVLDDKSDIALQKSKFSITVAGKNNVQDNNEFTRSLISASGEKIDTAYGIYIDGNLATANKDKEYIDKVLNEKLKPEKDKNPESKVEFAQKVEIVEGLYPVNLIINNEDFGKKINSNVQEEKTYTVKMDDTPLIIAEKTNVPLNELRRLNPNLVDLMVVGVDVVLSPERSLLEVKVVKSERYEQEIPYEVEEVKSSKYRSGYKKTTQEGENGTAIVTAEVSYIDGIEVSRDVLSSDVTSSPVNKQVIIGTGKSYNSYSSYDYNGGPIGSGGTLNWPTNGGYISNGYLGYYNHRAIDIANDYGSPIYAADDGVVVTSGWSSGGYGRYVVIDHGNGMQTLYGHNSKNLVYPGQRVSRGQTIARVGSTGNSTGNHVHFEVIVNGVKKNPNYYL